MIKPDLKRPLLIIMAVHLVYVVLALVFKQVLLVDSYGYLMQADNLLQHGTWYAEQWDAPLLVDYFSIRPPLYASVLALFSFFPLGWIWVLAMQNVLSILNCVVVYRFAQELGVDEKRLKMIGAIALLFYPAQFIHANFVMTEMFFQSLLLVLFIGVWRFMQQPSIKQSVLIAVFLCLCLLTKPVSLFLPWMVLIALVWSIVKHKQPFHFLWPLLGVALVFHLICLQNKHATGYYHYSSIKSINQLKYNARFALADASGEVVADSVVAEVVRQANSYDDYGLRLNYFDSSAMSIIKQHPVSFASVFAKGVIAFFVDPGRFEVYHFFNIEANNHPGLLHEVQAGGVNRLRAFVQTIPLLALIILFCNLCWNLIVVLCFMLFVLYAKVPLSLRVLIATLVMYIAMATGPVGVSRYRVPVAPFLVLTTLVVSAHPRAVLKFKPHA